MLGPTIATDRLTLRPPHGDDFEALCAFGRSEERMRFLGGTGDANKQWIKLLADMGHWALRGYGLFSIEAGGRLAGRAGVIFHHHNDEPELAWHLFEGFERHGYATEAAAAARDWYYRETGNGPLMSWVNIENLASQAVARRLGALVERDDTTESGHVGQIWRHPRTT